MIDAPQMSIFADFSVFWDLPGINKPLNIFFDLVKNIHAFINFSVSLGIKKAKRNRLSTEEGIGQSLNQPIAQIRCP